MQSILQRLQRLKSLRWGLFVSYALLAFALGGLFHIAPALLALPATSGGISWTAVLALLKEGAGSGASAALLVAIGFVADSYHLNLPPQVLTALAKNPLAGKILEAALAALAAAEGEDLIPSGSAEQKTSPEG